MKRTIIGLLVLLPTLAMAAPPHADNRARGHQDTRGQQDYRRQHDYRGQHGYRPRPYNQRRHYDHYRHDDRRYNYRGHWRSWKSWEAYRRQHHDRFRHGHYYRQDGHLMFRFCDPQGGSCFFFSIGR